MDRRSWAVTSENGWCGLPGIRAALMVVAIVGLIVSGAAAASGQDDDDPAAERPDFWMGLQVIQMFGNVFCIEDKADVATKHYWSLDDTAAGKVIELVDGKLVRVEFPTDKGWHLQKVPEPKTELKFRTEFDSSGWTETVTVVREEGIRVGPRAWGRVISEDGTRRIVEFPIELIGLKSLERGDRVVRGPDWRAGYADGGANPVGKSSPDCVGEVLTEVDGDRYVKVRWEKTGREGYYRFNKRRFYDVLQAP